MDLAMIGLGRMGANMTERLLGGGHRVVVHDIDPQAVERAVKMVEGLLSVQEGFSNALLTMVEAQRKSDAQLEKLLEIQKLTDDRVASLIAGIENLCQRLEAR